MTYLISFVIAFTTSLVLHYWSKRKETDMAVVYVTLIVKGKKSIADVPERLRKEVEELLEALEV